MFSKETIKRKHGFTLVELIVVLVIITVIASVAVPSIAGYIIKMKQMARDEMAAALFKISQTAITDIYSAGNQEELEYKGQVDASAIAPYLDPEELENNTDNLVYMSINKSSQNKDSDPLVKLLDPYVVDKEALQQTILLEYNVNTGKVLSVFYSDEADIGYGQGAAYNAFDRSRNSLKEGKMGYWAVDSTGIPVNTGSFEDMSISLVDYDGELRGGETQEGNEINGGRNYGLLTCECVLPAPQGSAYDYEITLDPQAGTDEVIEVDTQDWASMNTSLSQAVNGNGIYAYQRASGQTVLVIVLDTPYSSYSIKNKFPDLDNGNLSATLKASMGGSSDTATSNTVNVFYGDQSVEGAKNVYSIYSVRHLNNIRYNTGDNSEFVQKKDVVCRDWNDSILAFKALYANEAKGFKGTYKGMEGNNSYKIYDLTVTGTSSAGLFAKVEGEARVNGVYLDYTDEYYSAYEQASEIEKGDYFIRGTQYAGGIAGNNQGTIRSCTVEGKVFAKGSGAAAGGIAGIISFEWWTQACPDGTPSTVTHCMSAAWVNGEGMGTAGTAASSGGIAGSCDEGKIYYCETGTACGVAAGTREPVSILGVPYFGARPENAAYDYSTQNIMNNVCMITGTNPYDSAGGIAGKTGVNNPAGDILYCVNAAKIISDRAGGLVGQLLGAHSIVRSSYNAGAVQGDNYAGGLAGYFNIATIRSCYNTGPVKAGPDAPKADTKYAGGLVAYMAGGAHMYDSYSIGFVEEEEGPGNKDIQKKRNGGIGYWNRSGAITNCAFLKKYNKETTFAGCTAMSQGQLKNHPGFDGMRNSPGNTQVGIFEYFYAYFDVDNENCSLGEDFQRTPWDDDHGVLDYVYQE